MLSIKSWFCFVFPSQRAVQVGFQRSIQEPSPDSTQPIPTWEQTHCLISLMFFPSSNLTLEDPALAQQPWKDRFSAVSQYYTHLAHKTEPAEQPGQRICQGAQFCLCLPPPAMPKADLRVLQESQSRLSIALPLQSPSLGSRFLQHIELILPPLHF